MSGPAAERPEGPDGARPPQPAADEREGLSTTGGEELSTAGREGPATAEREGLSTAGREGPSTAEREELYADEREAQRLQRANRATRGGLAVLLCLEAFVVLLVPRGIAQTEEGVSTTKTLLLVGLAVVLVGSAFLLGRRWGIALGSFLQLALAATILLIPAVAVVVVMFVLLWLYLLRTRHTWLGTPRGWRMLVT